MRRAEPVAEAEGLEPENAAPFRPRPGSGPGAPERVALPAAKANSARSSLMILREAGMMVNWSGSVGVGSAAVVHDYDSFRLRTYCA